MQFKLLLAIFAVVMTICVFAPAEVKGDVTYHFDTCAKAPVCFKCCGQHGWEVAEELAGIELGCVCES